MSTDNTDKLMHAYIFFNKWKYVYDIYESYMKPFVKGVKVHVQRLSCSFVDSTVAFVISSGVAACVGG